MMEILKSTGIKYPIDIFMYDYLLKENMISGYSLHPEKDQVVFHGHNKYGSVIDIDGKRGMLDV